MRRFCHALAVGVVALLVLTQLALPAFLERDGGRAAARTAGSRRREPERFSGAPAARRATASGSRSAAADLEFVPGRGEQVLRPARRLRRGRVQVDGLEVEGRRRQQLHPRAARGRASRYRLSMNGTHHARREVGRAARLGGRRDSRRHRRRRSRAARCPGGGDTELPLTSTPRSRAADGRTEVVRTDATGRPACPPGPLTELVVSAVVVRPLAPLERQEELLACSMPPV